MNKFIVYICILLTSIAINSCRKDNLDIIVRNLEGRVINHCTDNGSANTMVNLYTRNGSSTSIFSTITDAMGNFSFKNVSIHSDLMYSYSLGINERFMGPYTVFSGDGLNLDKSTLNKPIYLYIETYFRQLNFVLNPSVPIIYPDTIIVTAKQKIYIKNVPEYSSRGNLTFTTKQFPCTVYNPLPTGWWEITVNKTKGGINTITKDSIYFDYDGQYTDTIPW